MTCFNRGRLEPPRKGIIQSIIKPMERDLAEIKFNSQPVICQLCKQQLHNVRMLIHKDNRIICYSCSITTPTLLDNIKLSYKEYYYDIIRHLPVPDHKTAKSCLQFVASLRKKVEGLLENIKAKIASFQRDLGEFLEQTIFICQGYIDKIHKIEESDMSGWLKKPPMSIDQQKYIINIKHKQLIAQKIEDSLHGLSVSIPNIKQIKKDTTQPWSKVICDKVSITAAVTLRGLLYQGTNDGRIIYEEGLTFKEIQAHSSLVRILAHDGQFTLYSGSDDQLIKAWNLRSEEPKLILIFGSLPGINSSHRHLAVLDGGRYMASSRGQFDSYKIRIWDLQSQKNIKTLDGHDGYIRGMIVNNKGQIITVSEDRYLKIWDIKCCSSIGQYYHGRKIYYVFAHKTENLLCITDEDNKLLLLEEETLQLVNALHMGKKILCVGAGQLIYVHIGSFINIYNWHLNHIERIDLKSTFSSTNLLEVGNQLVLTDAHGILHLHYPQILKH